MSLSEIATGWLVLASEGSVGIGGVRAIHKDHLVVHIEGFGEVNVRADQVKSAHDGKVVLDMANLPEDMIHAIARAHGGETSD